MSGFDPHWLALREAEDHRARNADVARACAAHFAHRNAMTIVDIGCGTGSNLRALAPLLPARQSWRLIDHDTALLASAHARLTAWAEEAEDDGASLRLAHNGKTLAVAFEQRDLARDVAGIFSPKPDLVTAAALFDLVSADWIATFSEALAARNTSLMTVLTYTGQEQWTPRHAADSAVLAAFHAHQARDKGFGPAAGPRAADVLQAQLATQGYDVRAGASDWRLEAGAALTRAVAAGVAEAVRETGLVNPDEIAAWHDARQSARARVSHIDIFAARSA